MSISKNLSIEECPEFFRMIDSVANTSEKTVCLMNIEGYQTLDEGYQTLDEAYLLMRQLWIAHKK